MDGSNKDGAGDLYPLRRVFDSQNVLSCSLLLTFFLGISDEIFDCDRVKSMRSMLSDNAFILLFNEFFVVASFLTRDAESVNWLSDAGF